MTIWQGVFPAVTTKMTREGALDLDAHQAALERLVAGGVSGLIVLPMLGENASLSLAEKEAVVRASVEVAAGRVPVLSGLAEITTEGAGEAARNYERWGAEGLMAFPSIVYRTDPRETAAWYQALAAACGLPIMIYNNPIAYGVDVTPETLARLADTPSIVCVKEETGNIRRITDIFNALGDRFSVFCGVDDLLLESVALGATGWVAGMVNAWPEESVRLFDLCRAGKFAEALPLYRAMTPAFHLDTEVKLVQNIKLAEHIVCGAPEWTRAPRLPLEGAERARVETIVRETMEKLKGL